MGKIENYSTILLESRNLVIFVVSVK